MNRDLTKFHCVPCEGGVKPFTLTRSKEYLKMTRGWELLASQGQALEPMRIQKKFEFKNFKEALNFVNKVGRLAESENHHPDIFIHNYRRVTITLTTYSIKGLSENDFIMASKINQI